MVCCTSYGILWNNLSVKKIKNWAIKARNYGCTENSKNVYGVTF